MSGVAERLSETVMNVGDIYIRQSLAVNCNVIGDVGVTLGGMIVTSSGGE